MMPLTLKKKIKKKTLICLKTSRLKLFLIKGRVYSTGNTPGRGVKEKSI